LNYFLKVKEILREWRAEGCVVSTTIISIIIIIINQLLLFLLVLLILDLKEILPGF